MTAVSVYSYAYSVSYVTDNILKSLKDIILASGLSPAGLADEWADLHLAISTWIQSEHLQQVVLEVFNPTTNALVIRWDIDIVYAWDSSSGRFWTDTAQLRYAIQKQGIWPSDARYRVLLRTKPGRPQVGNWRPGTSLSLQGFVRQSLGTTVEHSGLSGSTHYWRRSA
jgi:Bacterial HORMA domain 2